MSEEIDQPKKRPVKKKISAKKSSSKTKTTTTKAKPRTRKQPVKHIETSVLTTGSRSKSKKGSGAKSAVIIVFIIIILGGLAFFEYLGQSETVDPVYQQNSEQNYLDVKRIRPSTAVGSFYPESKRLLQEEIYSHLISAENRLLDNESQMLIVPHAGTKYSGPVAGYAFKTVVDKDFQRVIILGPSHHFDLQTVAVSSYGAWRTPLGEVDLDEANAGLIDQELFVENDAAFLNENSVEVQIPFIQALYPEATIIPLVVGQLSEDQRIAVATKISELIDDQTLLLISSDLSHYLVAEEAEEIDSKTIDLILAGQQEQMSEIDACGREAILIANLIAGQQGWGAKLLEYQHTGNITGDNTKVVGYPAIVYGLGIVPEFIAEKDEAEDEEDDTVSGDDEVLVDIGISIEDQNYLLDLARTTIETYLLEGVVYEPEEPEDEFLLQKSGAFVTLEIDQELRGCIGHIVAQEALYLAVRDNAIAAAVEDERFDPLTVDELEEVKIEISILTNPEPVSLLNIQADLDGLIIHGSDTETATFLPQVWESFATPIDFLEALSEKAGLESDAWQDSRTSFERYRAIVFGE